MRIPSRLEHWIAQQDDATLDALARTSSWISSTILVLVIVAIGSWIPSTSAHLELEAKWALVAWIFPAIGGFGLALVHKPGRRYSRIEWMSSLWTSATLQMFCAIVIARSSVTGSILFSPLLLFSAATHGFMLRSTAATPFPTLGTAFASLVGIILCRTPEQALLLGLDGVLACAGSLYLGTLAVTADNNREERRRMAAAIAAQQMHEQTRKVEELSGSLVDVLGQAHDARNALSIVDLATDLLATVEPKNSDEHHTIERVEKMLREGSQRLHTLVNDILRQRAALGDGASSRPEPADLATIVEDVVRSLSERYRSVVIETTTSSATVVEVFGGAHTVTRVVENLIVNAAEGDGRRGASRIVIRSEEDGTGAICRIIVEDDGPGFAREMLEAPVRPFSTSKPAGTGLGLYTAERLVAASGGTLKRENRTDGGARISVTVPRSRP